jgi:hypothetical protein
MRICIQKIKNISDQIPNPQSTKYPKDKGLRRMLPSNSALGEPELVGMALRAYGIPLSVMSYPNKSLTSTCSS